MAELDLDAMQARADAADAGPWTMEPSSLYVQNADGEVVASFDWLAQTPEEWAQLEANARFAAAARTDVPALAAEVKQLRAAVTRVRELPVYLCGSNALRSVRAADIEAALDGEAATDA
jgi:hypothetical protein